MLPKFPQQTINKTHGIISTRSQRSRLLTKKDKAKDYVGYIIIYMIYQNSSFGGGLPANGFP